MLEAEKQALKALEEEHEESLRKLKTEQSSKIIALKKKHKQDKIELEKQVEEAKKEAEANPAAAIDIDEHLERMLQEFEQAEHTHAVQIQSLEESHQSELNHLENNQKAQLNKLKHTQNLNRDSWTTRYLPTDAVSWPLPNRADAPKLRPTPLVESKSKTLLRVLGNMPGYQKPEPVLTPLDPKKVQVYYSSVSGNAVVRIQKRIMNSSCSNQ
jgi:DNA polymerase III alpha subunit (gram-positive type)